VSAVFADTFYWIALTNKRDSAHQVVMNFTASLGNKLLDSPFLPVKTAEYRRFKKLLKRVVKSPPLRRKASGQKETQTA
jgi:hypothetical protein